MMKNAVLIIFVLSFSILFAQEKDVPAPFSNFQTGVYGGINFNDISAIGGSFFFEVKTNLISNLNLKFSAGYSKSYLLESSTVKTYRIATIDSITFYNALTFNSDKKGYDVFPIALGFQYVFKSKYLSPYLVVDASYNLISAKVFRSSGTSMGYLSFEEIPDEFKTTETEELPDNSTSLSFGAGIIYPLSAKLNLDFRYYYRIDSEIINTHNVLVGITF
jgi:opacity protein-like surface antigen